MKTLLRIVLDSKNFFIIMLFVHCYSKNRKNAVPKVQLILEKWGPLD